MTQMQAIDSKSHPAVNDTNAYWSMTLMKTTESKSHPAVDDTNASQCILSFAPT